MQSLSSDKRYCYGLLFFLMPTISVAAASSAVIFFTIDMSRGMSAQEVNTLQQCLKRDSSVYPEGVVSGYFGVLTEKAVQRFQTKNSIVMTGTSQTTGFGRVGPKTRGKLNEFCNSSVQFLSLDNPQTTSTTQPTQTIQPQASPTQVTQTDIPSPQEQQAMLDEWSKIDVNAPLGAIGPGNCATIKQCIDYCAIPKNSIECLAFAP